MHEEKSGKRLANACSVPIDDAPNGVSGKFLTHFLDFMKDVELLKWMKQKI